MRALILAILTATASAQAPEEERVTFTRSELEAMQQELNAILKQREAAAYLRGQADVRQRCASLV